MHSSCPSPCFGLSTRKIERIANAVQVTNPQCHDGSFSICQEKSTVSLSHPVPVPVPVPVQVFVFLAMSLHPTDQLPERLLVFHIAREGALGQN